MTKTYTFSPGINTSFSTQLNQDFTDVDHTFTAAYSVGTSVSAAASQDLTATVSYSVPSPIKDYVIFNMDAAFYSAASFATTGNSIALYADNVLLKDWSTTDVNTSYSGISLVTPTYYVIPSASQKTSGISLKVQVRARAGSSSSSTTYLRGFNIIRK